MKKNQILYFLLIILLVLSVTACNLWETDTNEKTDADKKEIENINNQKTVFQEKIEEPDNERKEIKTPSEGELINLIYSAESTFLALCAEGFDAEFNGTEKKNFKEISEDLFKYYTKNYLYPEWEDFYENHLSEWGYGMGELFHFSNYDIINDSFIKMTNENGQIKVYLNFNASGSGYYSPENEILKYIYTLVQVNGKWLIDEIHFDDSTA